MDDSPNFMNFLVLNCIINPIIVPIIKIEIIINLWLYDIIYSCSDVSNQVNHEPDVIPNILSNIIGVKASNDKWLWVMGCDFILDLLEDNDIRIEYDAVIPIDIVINNSIVMFILDDSIFSKITSLEKNPDMNGIPIKANLLIPKIDKIIGKFRKLILIIRISWYVDSWIIIPAHKNIADLNKAWIIRCINARIIELIEMANIIIAICLRVDKAMIFFRSCSQFADILA